MSCWGCGSTDLEQAPDRRPVSQPKYFCRSCRLYWGSVRTSASTTKKEKDE